MGLLEDVKAIVADSSEGPHLHDLLHSHAAAVVNGLLPDVQDTHAEVAQEAVRIRVAALEEAAEPLVKSAFAVAYFCPDAARLLVGVISRLANGPSADQGHTVWLGLTRYPASLVLYGAGLGAVAGRREELLGPLLATACVRNPNREVQAIALAVYPQATLDERLAKLLPDLDRHHTPVSDRVYEVVTPWLAEQVPDPSTWDSQFDRWEFLLGLIALDISRGSGEGGWGPVGRFSWRNRHGGGITDEILREIETPETWPPVRGGLFGTNGERLAVSASAYLHLVGRTRNSQW